MSESSLYAGPSLLLVISGLSLGVLGDLTNSITQLSHWRLTVHSLIQFTEYDFNLHSILLFKNCGFSLQFDSP